MADQAATALPNPAKKALGMSSGKFAMWAFLCSDAMGFAGLFAAFVVARAHEGIVLIRDGGQAIFMWPNPTEVLNIPLTALNTFILICSSVTMVLALEACRRDDQRGLVKWLAATMIGGMFFLGVQVYEYMHLAHFGIVPWEDNFCATFYALTCYHGAHVLSGVIYIACMLVGAMRGKYGPHNYLPIEIVGLFWHFVDLVWILLFTFVYLLEPIAPEGVNLSVW